METQIAKKTQSAFDLAKKIYEEGGHSKSYAILTLDTPPTSTITKRTEFIGQNAAGQDVRAKVYAETTDGTLKLQYLTTSVQASYVDCQVGALAATGEANTNGCKYTFVV